MTCWQIQSLPETPEKLGTAQDLQQTQRGTSSKLYSKNRLAQFHVNADTFLLQFLISIVIKNADSLWGAWLPHFVGSGYPNSVHLYSIFNTVPLTVSLPVGHPK